MSPAGVGSSFPAIAIVFDVVVVVFFVVFVVVFLLVFVVGCSDALLLWAMIRTWCSRDVHPA